MTDGVSRRQFEIEQFRNSDVPISGTAMGKLAGVSRQVVVQDIALLRTAGYNIISTPRGYMLSDHSGVTRIIKTHHSLEDTAKELEIIVDNGGAIVDVRVNHRVYGKMTASLNIKNRKDIKNFIKDIETGKSSPLMNITSGYHFHQISADDEKTLDEIEEALKEEGFLTEILPYEEGMW